MTTKIFFMLGTAAAILSLPQSPPTIQRGITDEITATFTRQTKYLDTQWNNNGWNYSVPSKHYREIAQHSRDNLRLQMTLASFYRFRQDAAALEKIRAALRNVLVALPKTQPNAIKIRGQTVSTRSFNDTIGLYLALRALQHHPDILPPDEQTTVLRNIKEMFPWALRGNDTENRAFLGAAYATAILGNPLLAFTPTEQQSYRQLIQRKIDQGLKAVGRDWLYREGADRQFSLHYHLVSATMLWYVGHTINVPRYMDIATRMVQNVHRRYPMRQLQVRNDERPSGVSLQLVLLRVVGEKMLGNADWQQYWHTEKTNRGFVDPKFPNRLSWRDDGDNTINDDYSFANIAELFWETLTN